MADPDIVIVFAKPALPGSTKTRLVPPLTPEEAAEFHLAALSDTLAIAREAGGRVELHVAGSDDDLAEFHALYPGDEVRRQVGDNLGERLSRAFEAAFAAGCERVLIVGSDHPSLPARYVAAGLKELRSSDAVFGPSRDGGYYAVGLRCGAWPAARSLFEGIPWSTPAVLSTSLARARTSALSVALTPPWYDVDRPEDLERLSRDAATPSASLRFLRELERRRT